MKVQHEPKARDATRESYSITSSSIASNDHRNTFIKSSKLHVSREQQEGNEVLSTQELGKILSYQICHAFLMLRSLIAALTSVIGYHIRKYIVK